MCARTELMKRKKASAMATDRYAWVCVCVRGSDMRTLGPTQRIPKPAMTRRKVRSNNQSALHSTLSTRYAHETVKKSRAALARKIRLDPMLTSNESTGDDGAGSVPASSS